MAKVGEFQLRSCVRKKRYRDLRDASAAASTIRKRGLGRGGHVAAYPCDFCGGYHVGHNGEPERGRRRMQAPDWEDEA